MKEEINRLKMRKIELEETIKKSAEKELREKGIHLAIPPIKW